MNDDFIYWNVSILFNKNGTQNKSPVIHKRCCISLNEDGLFLVTQGKRVVYNLIRARAFPKACGILITGFDKFVIKNRDAFRYQELWCHFRNDLETG